MWTTRIELVDLLPCLQLRYDVSSAVLPAHPCAGWSEWGTRLRP